MGEKKKHLNSCKDKYRTGFEGSNSSISPLARDKEKKKLNSKMEEINKYISDLFVH